MTASTSAAGAGSATTSAASGFIGAFIVLFGVLTLAGVGVLVDSARIVSAERQASSAAYEAARAGAQAVQVGTVRDGAATSTRRRPAPPPSTPPTGCSPAPARPCSDVDRDRRRGRRHRHPAGRAGVPARLRPHDQRDRAGPDRRRHHPGRPVAMDQPAPLAPASAPAGSWLRFVAAVDRPAGRRRRHPGRPGGRLPGRRSGRRSHSPASAPGTRSTARVTTQRSSTEIARVALRVLISSCWLLWAGLLLSVLSSVVASRPEAGARPHPAAGHVRRASAPGSSPDCSSSDPWPRTSPTASPPSAPSRSGRVRNTAPRQRRRLLEPPVAGTVDGRAGPSCRPPSRSRCSPPAPSATPAVGPRCGS